jgi:ribonucleotide reductase beta subunit family protein with ferritin-like domain
MDTIKTVLAFFNSSDVLVAYDILPDLQKEIPDELLEVKFFYALQASVENVHSTTYSELIDNYFNTDPDEKTRLFNALETFPIVKKK